MAWAGKATRTAATSFFGAAATGPPASAPKILLVRASRLGIAVISNLEGVPQLPEPVINGILYLAPGFPTTDWNKAIPGASK